MYPSLTIQKLAQRLVSGNINIVFSLVLHHVYHFRDRALRPILGVIDPDHTLHCGPELTAFSGLDVLCHALESFTAVPYHNRGKRPETPMMRPAYQVSFDLSNT